jgi:hypothetical protein
MAAISSEESQRATEYFVDEGAPLVGVFDDLNPKLSISDAVAKFGPYIHDDLKIELSHAKRHFNKPPSASSLKNIGLDIDEVCPIHFMDHWTHFVDVTILVIWSCRQPPYFCTHQKLLCIVLSTG